LFELMSHAAPAQLSFSAIFTPVSLLKSSSRGSSIAPLILNADARRTSRTPQASPFTLFNRFPQARRLKVTGEA
jgi:hypothetical protein